MTGWWYTYPSEKYESQLGLLFPIYGTIKNVPNHQPNRIDFEFCILTRQNWSNPLGLVGCRQTLLLWRSDLFFSIQQPIQRVALRENA
jgi:hypothetical protein